jgi:UDP-N-acetylmuramoyl-L-alanyl-D-glutamate--2,6-diaminopimelate ligase
VALPGAHTHGARFAADAASNGAVAVLTDDRGAGLAMAAGLPVLVAPAPREHLGDLAAWLFGNPASRLTMFGVTGTNGKTTTTFLLDGALRRGGRVTGMVGTIQTRIGDEVRDSVRTTPEAPELHALLAAMVRTGADACSMEVSSHALALGRVDGIVFDIAGFTNLSQDHLDFHRTMDDYFAAKAQLFTPAHARRAVICVGDDWGQRLAKQAQIPVTTLATEGSAAGANQADWTVTDPIPDGGGTRFTLHGPEGVRTAARCPLPGDFNVANTALALVMLVGAGVTPAEAADWLAGAESVPGRMQHVTGAGAPGEPLAVVDYAHTPDAVAAAAQALRDRGEPLVVVLGAGGDRDREKRPLMGAAAAGVADVVIVTDDNPRSEDPAAIRSSVLAGARASAGPNVIVLEIESRAQAIDEAVRRAWGGGTVLVAGKGHERGQEIAGVVHAFDDRDVLTDALKRCAHAPPIRTNEANAEPTLEGQI